MQIEIADILVEIGASRSLHAETATAERNFIEIKLENFLLRQDLFDALRKDHLLELASHRIFVAQQKVFGDLLRNGRATDSPFSGAIFGGIVEHGIKRAGEVDPAMAEKGLVLRRQERFDQRLRKIDILKLNASLTGIGMDDFTVHAAYHSRQRGLVFEEGIGFGQIARQRCPGQHQQQKTDAHEIGQHTQAPAIVPVFPHPGEQAHGIAGQASADICKIGDGNHIWSTPLALVIWTLPEQESSALSFPTGGRRIYGWRAPLSGRSASVLQAMRAVRHPANWK